jgi:hypothetical protein
MAKYRITALPDSLPLAQNGGSFWKKRYNVAKSKKLKKNTVSRPNKSSRDSSNEEEEVVPQNNPMVEVQGVEQPSYWNDMMSEAEQGKKCPPGLYDYEGTGECVTEEEYVKRTYATMEEEQKAFDTKRQKWRDDFNAEMQQIRADQLQQKRDDFKRDSENYYKDFYDSKKNDKIRPWQSLPTYDLDKLENVYDEEGNTVIDPKTGKPKQQTKLTRYKNDFLVNKTENGYYELYPKDLVIDRIYKNGFTEDQFKNIWGLDAKQVKEQMGAELKNAGSIYKQNMEQHILKTAIEKNMSVEDVIKTMPKSWGTQQGLTSNFKNSTQKILDDAFTEMQNNILNSMEYDVNVSNKDSDVFYSDDPKTAWENKYHSNDLKYLSDKVHRGQKAHDEYMTKFGKIGQGAPDEYLQGQGRYDDTFAKDRLINQGIQKSITSSRAEASRQGAQDKEFNEAFGKYMGNESANIQKELFQKALAKVGNDPKAKINFLRNAEKYPDLLMGELLQMKDDESGKTFQDLYGDRVEEMYNTTKYVRDKQGTIKEVHKSELTTGDKIFDYLRHPFHAAYYAMHPTEDMHGNWNIDYDTRLKLEKEKGINLGTMNKVQGINPMSVLDWTPVQALNPFKIGSNLRYGYDKGDFTGALADEIVDIGTSVGFAKGLNAISGAGLPLRKAAGTLLQSTFNPLADIGYGMKAGQSFDRAIDHFKKGEYSDAGWEGLYGTLDALPLIGLPKYLRGFNKFDDAASGFNFNRTFNNTNQLNFNRSNLLGTQQMPKYSILNKDGQFIRNQYKMGGSLPKAQLGKIVSGLKSLGTVSKSVNKVKPLITAAEVNKLGPIIRANMPGMQARLSVANSLKDLGYVGNEFTGTDMFRAAKSNESMNKLMQLAIDHDRTGYRQVSGEFRPTGGLLGGYGNRGKYNMFEHHFDRPMSQVEHMRLSGVDINDPISLGAYQASTIPFQQYGYRAGIDDVNKGDALYLASLPEKYNRSYGPYQFKVTMPTDYSTGDWSTWYVKNIMGKKPYRLQEPYPIHTTPGGYNIPITRATPEPGEVLFDLGQSQGKGKDLFGSNNILTGSGLQTRRWVGTYGNEVGKVDPSFKFTDLMNMSTSDYKEMEDLRNSIIKGYNTGWRGQYKKGGMTMSLSKAEIDKYVKDGYIIEEE